MIRVNFTTYNNYVTDSLYQWDVNRNLLINGLGLSVAPEIHFTNANMDRAIVRQSTLDNGVITARIPNSLLQSALTIKAYVGVYEGETFKVIETIEIPVIAKNRPFDYTIEDSDEEIYSFRLVERRLDECATLSTSYNLVLSSKNWIGDVAPYANTLSVPKATAENNIELVTPSAVTVDEVKAYTRANIASATQSDGFIVVYAYGKKPSIDLPITVIVRGD